MISVKRTTLSLLVFAVSLGARAAAFDESKVVDLTYSFGADTIYWPTVLGLILLVIVLVLPDGLIGLVARVKARWGRT